MPHRARLALSEALFAASEMINETALEEAITNCATGEGNVECQSKKFYRIALSARSGTGLDDERAGRASAEGGGKATASDEAPDTRSAEWFCSTIEVDAVPAALPSTIKKSASSFETSAQSQDPVSLRPWSVTVMQGPLWLVLKRRS
jgi:hypothetical protein